MTVFSQPLHGLCRVLDRVRVPAIRLLGRPGRVLVRRRELRVAVFGSVVILTSLAGAVFWPLWLLALGPVILGVPHVLSDVRYLVMGPGHHRRMRFWLPVGGPLVAAGCGFHPVECGLVAVAAAAVLSRGAWGRKALVLLAAGAVGAAAWHAGFMAQIIFAHVHNLVALVLWWFWRPRTHASAGVVPALFFLAVLALGSGWLRPVEGAWSWFPGSGLDFTSHASVLAPGVPAGAAVRLVVLFAFAQSVHYGIWLRLIPEDNRPRETPRPFGATLRAMEADVGPVVFALAVLLAVGIGAWALTDLAAARIGYLRMALFHGYLELVAGTLLFLEGRPASATGTHAA